MNPSARQEQLIVRLACVVVTLHAAISLAASEPPPPMAPKALADKVRAEPVVRTAPSSARAPIDKKGAIVVPRENCGTFWTQWEKDPKADSNPCPANCERGERLDARERKTDSGMQYQTNYRCVLPELAVKQPSAALREPGAPPRTNCGTFWTTRQTDPNSAVNPCPENCERGELLDVKRGRSDDKLYYEMNYRCYVASPTSSKKEAGEAKSRVITTPKIEISGVATKVIRTEPIRISGITTKVIRTEPIRISGVTTKVIRTEPIRISGVATKVIRTDAIRVSGVATKVIRTDAIRVSGIQTKVIVTPRIEVTGMNR